MGLAAEVNACSIPVYRYALEHWRPDPYLAYVFHRGALTAEQQAHVELLQPASLNGAAAVNLVVKLVDVDGEMDERTAHVWEAHQTDALPHLVVQAPPKWGPPPTVFAESLTKTACEKLLDSPLRSNVTDRLIKGDSVVWVYLECGRKEEDDKAFSLLTQECQRLQGKLKPPEIDKDDLAELAIAPEALKIKLSAVRLGKEDSKEQFFRNMLLHVEADLRDEPYVNQPMAFPVFGRGRALYALVGDGLAPDLIEEACEFLTGACQCTVKAENPGVDLLMHVDWDRFVKPTEAVDASLPPLAGFTGFGELKDGSPGIGPAADETTAEADSPADAETTVASIQTEPSEPADAAIAALKQPESTPAPKSLSINVVVVLVLAAVVVMAATLILTRRTGA